MLWLITPKIHDQYQSLCFNFNEIYKNKDLDNFIKIFPNPTEGILHISSELKGKKLISIKDINNKNIVEFVSDENENVIDLRNFPKNIYFITIKTKEKSSHSKFCLY